MNSRTADDKSRMLQKYFDSSDLNGIATALGAMRAQGVRWGPLLHKKLISWYGQLGGPDEARKIFDDEAAAGQKVGIECCTAMMNVYALHSRCDDALALCQLMRSKGIKVDGEDCAHSMLIDTFSKHGQWETALRVFELMPSEKISRSTRTYNSMIAAFGRGGQWESALQLFESMPGERVPHDERSVENVIAVLARAGCFQQALHVLHSMSARDLKANTGTYSILMEALLEAGHPRAVVELFELMCSKRAPRDTAAFNAAIAAFEQLSSPEEGPRIGGTLGSTGGGRAWIHALRLFESMAAEAVPRNVSTFNAAISACGKGRQWAQVWRLFHVMRKKVKPDESTFAALEAAVVDMHGAPGPSPLDDVAVAHAIVALDHFDESEGARAVGAALAGYAITRGEGKWANVLVRDADTGLTLINVPALIRHARAVLRFVFGPYKSSLASGVDEQRVPSGASHCSIDGAAVREGVDSVNMIDLPLETRDGVDQSVDQGVDQSVDRGVDQSVDEDKGTMASDVCGGDSGPASDADGDRRRVLVVDEWGSRTSQGRVRNRVLAMLREELGLRVECVPGDDKRVVVYVAAPATLPQDDIEPEMNLETAPQPQT